MGESQDAPSGVNRQAKMALLENEGVDFDTKGQLVDQRRLWNDFAV